MCCEGKEIDLKEWLPPELQDLRKSLAATAQANMGRGATRFPEGTPYTAPMNQMQQGGMDILSMLAGLGRTSMPNPLTMGNLGDFGSMTTARTRRAPIYDPENPRDWDPTDPIYDEQVDTNEPGPLTPPDQFDPRTGTDPLAPGWRGRGGRVQIPRHRGGGLIDPREWGDHTPTPRYGGTKGQTQKWPGPDTYDPYDPSTWEPKRTGGGGGGR